MLPTQNTAALHEQTGEVFALEVAEGKAVTLGDPIQSQPFGFDLLRKPASEVAGIGHVEVLDQELEMFLGLSETEGLMPFIRCDAYFKDFAGLLVFLHLDLPGEGHIGLLAVLCLDAGASEDCVSLPSLKSHFWMAPGTKDCVGVGQESEPLLGFDRVERAGGKVRVRKDLLNCALRVRADGDIPLFEEFGHVFPEASVDCEVGGVEAIQVLDHLQKVTVIAVEGDLLVGPEMDPDAPGFEAEVVLWVIVCMLAVLDLIA
ncbi:MAG: hypothetical protein HDKAJFGB_02331 [Anaerolineae bacterium]|nr:hypothetical protein [Anaerolineae bacterium]